MKEYGIIVFQPANIGSKSEKLQPYLYKKHGEFLPVYLEGDNPFENSMIAEYDGEWVEADCKEELAENGMAMIKTIAKARSTNGLAAWKDESENGKKETEQETEQEIKQEAEQEVNQETEQEIQEKNMEEKNDEV